MPLLQQIRQNTIFCLVPFLHCKEDLGQVPLHIFRPFDSLLLEWIGPVPRHWLGNDMSADVVMMMMWLITIGQRRYVEAINWSKR